MGPIIDRNCSIMLNICHGMTNNFLLWIITIRSRCFIGIMGGTTYLINGNDDTADICGVNKKIFTHIVHNEPLQQRSLTSSGLLKSQISQISMYCAIDFTFYNEKRILFYYQYNYLGLGANIAAAFSYSFNGIRLNPIHHRGS